MDMSIFSKDSINLRIGKSVFNEMNKCKPKKLLNNFQNVHSNQMWTECVNQE